MKSPQSHLANMGFLQVLEDSRTVLTAANVLPDGPLPQDEKLKDGMVSPTLHFAACHPGTLQLVLLCSCHLSPGNILIWYLSSWLRVDKSLVYGSLNISGV